MAAAPESAEIKQFGDKMNGFAWKMFAQVTANDPARSPDTGVGAASVIVQLATLSLGSGERGISEARSLINGGKLEAMAREIKSKAEDRGYFKWFAGNVLVVPSGRPIRAQFIDEARTKFSLEVKTGDARGENGRKLVGLLNKTMDEVCEGHTEEMLTPDYRIRPDNGNGMVAATAVYFHPWWNVRFERNKTAQAPFYEYPGKERTVLMMSREDAMPYAEGELVPGVKVQVVGLACRRNKGMVYFVLPDKKDGLREVITHANHQRLTNLMGSCRLRLVHVWIPKIRMTETVQLRDVLAGLGLRTWQQESMNKILSDQCPMYVNEFLHQVVVRFNEDGDEETGEQTDPMENKNPIRVRFDHPFMFAFRQDTTNGLWLLGASSRPIYPKRG